ncbi:hypothetical protein CAPTEDRAFT_22890, partial [Capitella teleta]
NVGYRLAKRKGFFQRRKVVCDFALAFAILGIVLMIVETEISIAHITNGVAKDNLATLLLKTSISVSTATLLGFVVWYHILDVQLFMCDNSVDDWRLAMNSRRVTSILIELIVYAIHPPPGLEDYSYRNIDPLTGEPGPLITVPVDVLFSIPMFLRLFLLGRVIMLHSRLFTDASSQSLGALNRIHFNFSFIFKSMMTLYPEYVLLLLMLSGFVVASWMLRACEMYYIDEPQTRDFLNALWLISITFLSVGYGDIVPHSYCGRSIAVLTGIFGAGCTALVVAVLARKLELSRAEKYVHNFVIDVELDKRYKIAAANIVKAGWFVYKNKKYGKTRRMLVYQRKLLKAIHVIRDVKQEQRRMVDNAVSIVEMHKTQNTLCSLVQGVDDSQVEVDQKVLALNQRMAVVEGKLDAI